MGGTLLSAGVADVPVLLLLVLTATAALMVAITAFCGDELCSEPLVGVLLGVVSGVVVGVIIIGTDAPPPKGLAPMVLMGMVPVIGLLFLSMNRYGIIGFNRELALF